MVVAKQARDPLAIMYRVYNKEKHRERCGVFFFSRKSEKKTLFRYEIFLSKRTNVLYYVSINLSHTQINSINTHIILNHNARNRSFVIIFNLLRDE